MENTWYTRLKAQLQINATGIVAENLRSTLAAGIFQSATSPFGGQGALDVQVSNDVAQWFNAKFKPWFYQLTSSLTVENEVSELTSSTYANLINEAVAALFVARSYYAKKADETIYTSLKNVALYKALFCEEAAQSIAFAYEQALRQYGGFEGKERMTTVASEHEGSTPENFNWNNNHVLVNHVKFENVTIMEGENNQQQQQQNCSGNGQYLPWVICAAFGIIAWSAAAKKSNQ